MPTLRTFIATVLLGLGLCVGTLHAAEPPTAGAVQQSLDKIADRKLPDADQKALQAVLQQTLTLLESKADYEQRLNDVKQQLNDAPRQTGENQRELARLKASTPIPVAQRYKDLSVPQLRSRCWPSAPRNKVSCKKPWPLPTVKALPHRPARNGPGRKSINNQTAFSRSATS